MTVNPEVSPGNAAKSFLAFVALYIVLFGATGFLLGGTLTQNHAIGFASVILATVAAVALVDRGAWSVGVAVSPRLALRDTTAGVGVAVAVVGLSDILVQSSTTLRHGWVGDFPWMTVLVLYVPAAIHEELLFRGYPFQKIMAWNPVAGVVLSSALFAGLHLGNDAVGAVALANIALAGVLLSLAYLIHRTLWLPAALHIAWNILSGPVLGHEVSGFAVSETVLSTIDHGPVLLTGGAFGIEASLWTTLCETIAVALLLLFITMRRPPLEQRTLVPIEARDPFATDIIE